MDDLQSEILIEIQDLKRRMNNILRPGVIVATDPGRARVRVRLSPGDGSDGSAPLDTTWISVLQQRAGETIDWDFPEVGEQVLVLSPGGELSGGYVGHAIYSGKRPAPSNKALTWLRKFADGLQSFYDQDTGTFRITGRKDLKVIFDTISVQFNTERISIKNKAGDELFGILSSALGWITRSQTATMMGPQSLQPASGELPKLAAKIDSFGG